MSQSFGGYGGGGGGAFRGSLGRGLPQIPLTLTLFKTEIVHLATLFETGFLLYEPGSFRLAQKIKCILN